MSDDPRPFDGYEYRVTRRGGHVYEGCHAMSLFSGKGVIMVIPAVNGEGGALAGDLRDPHIESVERTGVHNEAWVASTTTKGAP